MAWPIMLANSTVPLLGLADTAVIGNTGTVADLGAIALGALVFTFVYWSFGFLRMGTTGFTAQAAGAGEEAEVRATLGRALLLAAGLGVAILVLQRPIAWASLELLGGSAEVEAITRRYVLIRIWGAPATLATFAVLGTFVGLGRGRQLLQTQVVLNGLNIGLDVLFAGVLGWGAEGIAAGTAIAEWTSLGFALYLAGRVLRERHRDAEPFWPWPRIADREKLAQTLSANRDLMLRTVSLLAGFAWFTAVGARLGDRVLAANHVLLQLVSMSAYFLDGYAFVTESLVGQAKGRRDLAAFDRAVAVSTRLAAGTAAALAAAILLLGGWVVRGLTDLPGVREAASGLLPWTALYVFLSFAAFQLDGVFIGVTRTRQMRDAAIVSLLLFLGASWLLVRWHGNAGLWAAFVAYVVLRAATLAALYPALRRSLAGGGAPARPA